MAQLKDSLITGSLRVTDTIYTVNEAISSLTASAAVVSDANKKLISRTILNNTSETAVTGSDSLITANTLVNAGYVKIGTTSTTAMAGNTVVNKVKTTAKTDDVSYKILLNGAGASPTSGSNYEAVYSANATLNTSGMYLTLTKANHTGDHGLILNNTESGKVLKLGYIIGTSGNGGIYDYTHSAWKVQIATNGTTTFTGDLTGHASSDLALTGGALTGNVTNSGTIIALASSGVYTSSTSAGINFYFLRGNTNATENKMGLIFMQPSATNGVSRPDRFYFRQYTYNSSTGAISDYWDQYRLPAATAGLTSANTYEIITTKNLTDITSVGTISTATTLSYKNNTTANHPLTIIRGNTSGAPRLGGLSIWKVGDTTTAYNVAWLYIDKVGVANTAGIVRFTLGNETASTADGNYCGKLRLYGSGTASTDITGTTGSLGGSSKTYAAMGYVSATQVYGAVWNDYAEFRKTNHEAKPGQVVVDNDDGSLSLSSARLLPGAQVVSDTYGFAIGETKETETPLAVSGRVLVYTYRDRSEYHAGQAVCSAPNGTVDIMTRQEINEYPDAIIGIVSEIPNYEEWGTGKVKVNGRIWIKVK